jgi:hypothetical protein
MASSDTLRDSSRYMILIGITGGVLFLAWTGFVWLQTGLWQPAVIADIPLWISQNVSWVDQSVSACGRHDSWEGFFEFVCWLEGLWLWIAFPVVGLTSGWLREL